LTYFGLIVTSGVIVAYVALARRSPRTYVQVADQYTTGPDVRCCCGTSLSFVFSELSWEAFSKYGILYYVHSREKEQQPNLSDFVAMGPTS
jgi:hypothetical protein